MDTEFRAKHRPIGAVLRRPFSASMGLTVSSCWMVATSGRGATRTTFPLSAWPRGHWRLRYGVLKVFKVLVTPSLFPLASTESTL